VTHRPDILLLEGLNVLAPAPAGTAAVSDFIDFSVYVDAATEDIRRWYVERFLRLRQTAFRDPSSYFRRYAAMDEAAAVTRAEEIWAQINGPNLARNIAPTQGRANLVLCKGPGHDVTRVRLRKV
jgi:type I pantothenate kinase